MPHDFDGYPETPETTSLSVALVSRHGLMPAPAPGIRIRHVSEPCEVRPGDDVILFYGPGIAQEVRRFSVETAGALPPAAVLAPWLDWADVCLALHHGAISYLLENRFSLRLVEALWCTSRGGSILDPVVAAEQVRVACEARMKAVVQGPAGEPVTPTPEMLPQLSERERQLMDLLAAGLGVREVAREMSLTDKTVRNYLSRIYTKLGVRRQSEAILRWLGCLDTPVADGEPGEARSSGAGRP